MESFKVPTHFLVLKSVSMCTTEWITNFGFSIEASEKRCQKISTRPKMFDNGFISRHFVTIFETAKSTHDKLNQNVYFVVFLFSHFTAMDIALLHALILNRPNTKTYCKTSDVLDNVIQTCYEVVEFSLIRC